LLSSSVIHCVEKFPFFHQYNRGMIFCFSKKSLQYLHENNIMLVLCFNCVTKTFYSKWISYMLKYFYIFFMCIFDRMMNFYHILGNNKNILNTTVNINSCLRAWDLFKIYHRLIKIAWQKTNDFRIIFGFFALKILFFPPKNYCCCCDTDKYFVTLN